jgi:hypothetical protein
MQNFLGKDGFLWWMGVVESRNDPLNLGRCQVRIFGHHTENLNEIPTSDLAWALPSYSPNAAWVSSTPIPGDFVWGFFTDGASAQFPIIVGVYPGIPKSGPTSAGFSEGTHYPVNEPTTSRLYRNEKIEQTPIGYHNSNLDSNSLFSEPSSKYATKPPYNNVTETIAHVFEMDDTPGAERIHLNHKANTFFEIAPDGSMVTKVQGDNFSIYIKDNNVHVKGVCNIVVDGDTNIQVGGKVTGTAASWNLTGDINVTGKITASGDVVGGGISLDNHTHPDPQGGSTGNPQ